MTVTVAIAVAGLGSAHAAPSEQLGAEANTGVNYTGVVSSFDPPAAGQYNAPGQNPSRFSYVGGFLQVGDFLQVGYGRESTVCGGGLNYFVYAEDQYGATQLWVRWCGQPGGTQQFKQLVTSTVGAYAQWNSYAAGILLTAGLYSTTSNYYTANTASPYVSNELSDTVNIDYLDGMSPVRFAAAMQGRPVGSGLFVHLGHAKVFRTFSVGPSGCQFSVTVGVFNDTTVGKYVGPCQTNGVVVW